MARGSRSGKRPRRRNSQWRAPAALGRGHCAGTRRGARQPLWEEATAQELAAVNGHSALNLGEDAASQKRAAGHR